MCDAILLMCSHTTTGEKTMEKLEQIAKKAELDKTVEKMALYKNPVELVNNMYGCHPEGNGSDYFARIYKKQEGK